MEDNIIRANDFGDGQKRDINYHLALFMDGLIKASPQLAPHFLSGGTIDIKTMSGANLRFGFSPQAGGLIIPGGIRPAGQNGRLIK